MGRIDVDNVNVRQQQDNMANVLIVGDDAELTRFMLGILAQKGICGITANDKKNALDFIE